MICPKGIVMKKELIFQILLAALMLSLFGCKTINTDSTLTNKEVFPAPSFNTDACSSAAQKKQEMELTPEPADPDKYDMSVWENIESSIYSGFGSIDIVYSKSIPPATN